MTRRSAFKIDSIYRTGARVGSWLKIKFDQSQEFVIGDFNPEGKSIHQVDFTEWTNYGLLRHATYLGLREDKNPGEVIRESVGDQLAAP